MSFSQSLTFGKTAESAIARWLLSKGFSILPVYEKLGNEYKGPTLTTPSGSLIATDMLVYRANNILWVEAKHKTAFSWHRITDRWVTGIDLCHYQDYLQIAKQSPWPVWLLFLHEGGQAKDSPANSPAGLFGNNIEILRVCENHRHTKWGNGGMVYWAVDSLKQLALLEEIERLVQF